MNAKRNLYIEISEADDLGHVGLVCHLSERYLRRRPDHVPTLILYAQALRRLSRYSHAEKILDHAELVAPKKYLHLVLYQQGHLLHRQGKWNAAEEVYLRVAGEVPDDATGWIYAGCSAFRSGEVERAKSLARKATTCAEGCLDEAWFNLGGYLLSTGDYKEARECYQMSLSIDPNYSIAKKRLEDVELVLAELAASSASSLTTHRDQ